MHAFYKPRGVRKKLHWVRIGYGLFRNAYVLQYNLLVRHLKKKGTRFCRKSKVLEMHAFYKPPTSHRGAPAVRPRCDARRCARGAPAVLGGQVAQTVSPFSKFSSSIMTERAKCKKTTQSLRGAAGAHDAHQVSWPAEA